MMYSLRYSVASVLTLLLLDQSAVHAVKGNGTDDKGQNAPKATPQAAKPATQEDQNTSTSSTSKPAPKAEDTIPTPQAAAAIPASVKFNDASWRTQFAKVEGMSGTEPWGTWSEGNKVTLQFKEPLPTNFTLRLKAFAFGPNAGQDFTATVGGSAVRFKLNGGAEDRLLRFTNTGGANTLVIDVPKPTTPASLSGGVGDPRPLGMGLVDMGIALDSTAMTFKGQAAWPGLITKAQGLSSTEGWGTWSEGKTVTLEFAAALPAKGVIHLEAGAFGPNVGKDFVARIGDSVVNFKLAAGATKVDIPFTNAVGSKTVVIEVPQPTSPASLNIGNADPRPLGLGLMNLGIDSTQSQQPSSSSSSSSTTSSSSSSSSSSGTAGSATSTTTTVPAKSTTSTTTVPSTSSTSMATLTTLNVSRLVNPRKGQPLPTPPQKDKMIAPAAGTLATTSYSTSSSSPAATVGKLTIVERMAWAQAVVQAGSQAIETAKKEAAELKTEADAAFKAALAAQAEADIAADAANLAISLAQKAEPTKEELAAQAAQDAEKIAKLFPAYQADPAQKAAYEAAIKVASDEHRLKRETLKKAALEAMGRRALTASQADQAKVAARDKKFAALDADAIVAEIVLIELEKVDPQAKAQALAQAEANRVKLDEEIKEMIARIQKERESVEAARLQENVEAFRKKGEAILAQQKAAADKAKTDADAALAAQQNAAAEEAKRLADESELQRKAAEAVELKRQAEEDAKAADAKAQVAAKALAKFDEEDQIPMVDGDMNIIKQSPAARDARDALLKEKAETARDAAAATKAILDAEAKRLAEEAELHRKADEDKAEADKTQQQAGDNAPTQSQALTPPKAPPMPPKTTQQQPTSNEAQQQGASVPKTPMQELERKFKSKNDEDPEKTFEFKNRGVKSTNVFRTFIEGATKENNVVGALIDNVLQYQTAAKKKESTDGDQSSATSSQSSKPSMTESTIEFASGSELQAFRDNLNLSRRISQKLKEKYDALHKAKNLTTPKLGEEEFKVGYLLGTDVLKRLTTDIEFTNVFGHNVADAVKTAYHEVMAEIEKENKQIASSTQSAPKPASQPASKPASPETSKSKPVLNVWTAIKDDSVLAQKVEARLKAQYDAYINTKNKEIQKENEEEKARINEKNKIVSNKEVHVEIPKVGLNQITDFSINGLNALKDAKHTKKKAQFAEFLNAFRESNLSAVFQKAYDDVKSKETEEPKGSPSNTASGASTSTSSTNSSTTTQSPVESQDGANVKSEGSASIVTPGKDFTPKADSTQGGQFQGTPNPPPNPLQQGLQRQRSLFDSKIGKNDTWNDDDDNDD